MKLLSHRWWYLLPSIFWAIIIGVLSLVSLKQTPRIAIMSFDKIAHFGVYASLAFLLFWGVHKWRKGALSSKYLWVLTIGIILYGVSLEVAQKLFNPARYFEFLDILANIVGTLSGILFYKLIIKYF